MAVFEPEAFWLSCPSHDMRPKRALRSLKSVFSYVLRLKRDRRLLKSELSYDMVLKRSGDCLQTASGYNLGLKRSGERSIGGSLRSCGRQTGRGEA